MAIRFQSIYLPSQNRDGTLARKPFKCNIIPRFHGVREMLERDAEMANQGLELYSDC